MSIFIRNKKNLILLVLFILSVIPIIYEIGVAAIGKTDRNELFDSDLVRLNSVDKMINYTDSLYELKELNYFDTLIYVDLASEVTKKRFYFGLTTYNFSDNWIAYVCGKLIWPHFLAIVEPNDILKHPKGLCSQQTIVFMELMRRKGIGVRSVGFGKKTGPGHFLCEVQYNQSWHLYDVTIEPLLHDPMQENKSANYYLNNIDSFYKAYDGRISRELFNQYIEQVEFGQSNSFPAKNMRLFHQLTHFAVYALPIFLFTLFQVDLFRKYRSRKNKNSSVL